MTTANLVTVKAPGSLKLKGVTLDWQIEDGSPTRVTVTDRRGHSFTIAKGESYARGFIVMAPKPIEVAERFELSGSVARLKVREVFKSEAEAEHAKGEATSFGSVPNDLEIKAVKVPVDEDGNAVTSDEEIPF